MAGQGWGTFRSPLDYVNIWYCYKGHRYISNLSLFRCRCSWNNRKVIKMDHLLVMITYLTVICLSCHQQIPISHIYLRLHNTVVLLLRDLTKCNKIGLEFTVISQVVFPAQSCHGDFLYVVNVYYIWNCPSVNISVRVGAFCIIPISWCINVEWN